MKQDLQLKLQAFLDGELPSSEAKAVEALVAGDAAARDLLTELRQTRAVLQTHEAELKLPESREFYWSKIQRQIERQEAAPVAAPQVSPLLWLRRLLAPAGAVAVVLLGVLLLQNPANLSPGRGVAMMETDLPDAESYTYRDYSSGTTLVWLSYPAENEFTDMESDDILDFN